MTCRQVFRHYERTEPPCGMFVYCPFCGERLDAVELAGRSRPACTGCGFVQHRNPAPTVSVLIVDGDRVLLGKRAGDPGKGTWSLPSGYIEYEDDYLVTAIREAREETGLDVEVSSLINVVSSFVSPRYHFLGVYVAARVVGGELRSGDDLEAVGWYPLSGPLPEMGFEEDVEIIHWAARVGIGGLPVDARHAASAREGPDLTVGERGVLLS